MIRRFVVAGGENQEADNQDRKSWVWLHWIGDQCLVVRLPIRSFSLPSEAREFSLGTNRYIPGLAAAQGSDPVW